MGPLISPGFMVNATDACPDIEPTSGTCPSGRTRSLVFTVAPSSFAAFFKIVLGLGAVGQFLHLLCQQS